MKTNNNKVRDSISFHINNGGVYIKSEANHNGDCVEQTLDISAYHFGHKTNGMILQGTPEDMKMLGQYLIDIANEGLSMKKDSDRNSYNTLKASRTIVVGDNSYFLYPNGDVYQRDPDSVMAHNRECLGKIGEEITITQIKNQKQ